MAYIANFYLDAGASFTRSVTYTNQDGTVFDLTDYTAHLQVRETVGEAFVLIEKFPTIDVEAGSLTWSFTPAETSSLTSEKYVYAMELTHTDGSVIRLLEGDLTVSQEVVR